MAYQVDRLAHNQPLQDQVIDRINRKKKVIFKFSSEEDKIQFLNRAAELFTEVGLTAGSTIGAIAGGLIAGPIGAMAGGLIGGVVGAGVGYSFGVWLANFLWKRVVNKSNLRYTKAFSWFGLMPNRVTVIAY